MHDGDMGASIELIARGVLIGPRGILLCRNAGKDYTYLPGGHIELHEPASAALERELQEELGTRTKVEEFLGAVESLFSQDGQTHHEINLVFAVSSASLVRRTSFSSSEPHIEFVWQAVNTLASANLLPRPLRELIPQWTRGKHVAWASDIRN